MNAPQFSTISNSAIHPTARLVGWSNIYGCEIGENCFVGPFTELGGVKVGARSRISSHCYFPPGVTIGRDCFIGHGVMGTNDLYDKPEVYENIGELQESWNQKKTAIGNSVRIGSNATILPVTIGDHAIIGAGAVVCHDVPAYAVVAGVPAKIVRILDGGGL